MAATMPPNDPGPRRGSARPLTVVLATICGALLLVLCVTSIALWRSITQVDEDVAELRGDVAELEEVDAELGSGVAGLESEQLAEFDPTELAVDLAPSVFLVEARVSEEEVAQGSAFVLGKDGRRSLLVTNYHVIGERWEQGASDVLLIRGNREYVGEIIEVEPEADLALIEVAADLPALEPADTEPEVGDPVMVIGSGAGLEGTVTVGVVSALDRSIDGQTFMQFSAQVNPGNSGGPVFNADGEVVGVATAKLVALEVEGVSFAVPVETVCTLFDIC